MLRRLFLSTFPGGYPGLGLLLLRAAVGVTAVTQGVIYLTDRSFPTLEAWGVGLLLVTVGGSLLVGFLTPLVSFLIVLGSIGTALSWLPLPAKNLLDTYLSINLLISIAASIVLLGPGAFSIDSRMFGRREIIIPSTNRNSKS